MELIKLTDGRPWHKQVVTGLIIAAVGIPLVSIAIFIALCCTVTVLVAALLAYEGIHYLVINYGLLVMLKWICLAVASLIGILVVVFFATGIYYWASE